MAISDNGQLLPGEYQFAPGENPANVRAPNYQVMNARRYGVIPDTTRDMSAAFQLAFDAYGDEAFELDLDNGEYYVEDSIRPPAGALTGRTLVFRGRGQACIKNVAAANTPTLELVAASTAVGDFFRRVTIENICFTNDAATPNHGVHLRGILESQIKDCAFLMQTGKSGVYCDGATFDLAIKGNLVWPPGPTFYGSGSPANPGVGFLFDTPFAPEWGYANSVSVKENEVNGGSGGLAVLAGWANVLGWKLGRNLFEGTGGWGVELTGALNFSIIGLYTEANGTLGSVDDKSLLLTNCGGGIVLASPMTGIIRVRSCTRTSFVGNSCNALDIDASNDGITTIGNTVGVAGGPGAALNQNLSTNRIALANSNTSNSTALREIGPYFRVSVSSNGEKRILGTATNTAPTDGAAGDEFCTNGMARRYLSADETSGTTNEHVQRFTLANGGTQGLGQRYIGPADVLTAQTDYARVYLSGGNNIAYILDDPTAVFSGVKDTPSKINVYQAGGEYVIQNLRGADRDFSVKILATNG